MMAGALCVLLSRIGWVGAGREGERWISLVRPGTCAETSAEADAPFNNNANATPVASFQAFIWNFPLPVKFHRLRIWQ